MLTTICTVYIAKKENEELKGNVVDSVADSQSLKGSMYTAQSLGIQEARCRVRHVLEVEDFATRCKFFDSIQSVGSYINFLGLCSIDICGYLVMQMTDNN